MSAFVKSRFLTPVWSGSSNEGSFVSAPQGTPSLSDVFLRGFVENRAYVSLYLFVKNVNNYSKIAAKSSMDFSPSRVFSSLMTTIGTRSILYFSTRSG